MAHDRWSIRLPSYSLTFQKNGVKRIARWAIWSSWLLLSFREVPLAEDLDSHLQRTIPDRACDQEIALRPPHRSLATFRFAEESTHSLG